MLRLVGGTKPDAYPLADHAWMGAAALNSAWPALIAYPRGKIQAANQLLRWVSALASAEGLLDLTVLELSARILGSQRAPIACNPAFLLQKLWYINKLRSEKRALVLASFWRHYDEARSVSEVAIEATPCSLIRSARDFDERTPWRYPLRIEGVREDGRKYLLEFVVTEALLPRKHFLIMLEPDGNETRQLIGKIYDNRGRLFGGEDYIITRDKHVDIQLPAHYTERHIRKPKLEIIYLDSVRKPESYYPMDMESQERTAEERVASKGVPVFEFRPRQSFGEQELNRIRDAIGAELDALPAHPELGSGTRFRLGAAAGPGRVSQVDIYLDRPATRGAAVRVHRIDDFGEPQAARYRFDVGFLEEGDPPALVFRSTGEGQERNVTVYRDGRFDEAADRAARAAEALPTDDEASQGGPLPPVVGAKDAADLLQVSRNAVLSAIERGRLPASKVEGRWEIRRSDLNAYRQSIAHRQGKPGPRGKRSQAA
jgi:excisionase family DNA binding protein